MNNPMMPFGEEPSTLSLDMPQGLASILSGFSAPAVSTPPSAGIASNVGIGPGVLGATQQGMQIPSFQEGGFVDEGARAYGQMLRQRASTPLGALSLIPNPISGAIAAVDTLRQGAARYLPPPPPPPSPFGKYFPEIDKGSIGFGKVIIEPSSEGEPEPQQPTPASPTVPSSMAGSGGGGGGGYPGMPRGGGFFGLGGMLPETRKKPTVTVEEIKTPTVTVEELGDTSYAEGGMVGMEGMRVPPGAVPGMPMQAGVNPEMQAGTPMNPQMLEMQINQFVNRNPQQVAMIRQSILEELQSGELTPQELNMIVQLATVAAQNPEMYSYVRNFAIQQGIASEDDLPAQYDQGLVFVLLLAARAVQQDLGGAPVGMGQAPGSAAPVVPSMAKGGKIASSGESKPVIIEAHTGEYVIPKHVVDMKGKEFFDSLVEKYKDQK